MTTLPTSGPFRVAVKGLGMVLLGQGRAGYLDRLRYFHEYYELDDTLERPIHPVSISDLVDSCVSAEQRWYRLVNSLVHAATDTRRQPVEGATSRQEALLALDRLRTIADGSYFKPRVAPRRGKGVPRVGACREASSGRGRAGDSRCPGRVCRQANLGPEHEGSRRVSGALVQRIAQTRIAQSERKFRRPLSPDEREERLQSARATCNRRMTALRRMFNRLVENDQLPDEQNPLRRGKLRPYQVDENARTRYYSLEEIERIPAGTTEPFRSFVVLLLNVGFRRAELLRMKWDDWDRTSNTVRVRRTKSKKPKSLPLNSAAVESSREWRSNAGASSSSTMTKGSRGRSTGPAAWRRTCRKARLENARLHDCRHSFASHLTNRGVPLRTVQVLMGHSSIRLTERYSHLSNKVLEEAAEVMTEIAPSRSTRAIDTPTLRDDLPSPPDSGSDGLQLGLQEARFASPRERPKAKRQKLEEKNDGRDRARTCDMRRVRAPLCQLSYPPGRPRLARFSRLRRQDEGVSLATKRLASLMFAGGAERAGPGPGRTRLRSFS